MYLTAVTLRDWKAYGGETRLEFPRPMERKNVVLIGAPNGFGKTSLLEAIAFGLYGKDALPLAARANRPLERQADRGYPAFMQRALHGRALQDGRQSMTVEVELFDPESDPSELRIQRTWYFRADGTFKEEEVYIYEGEDRRPLKVPRLEEDASDFYRGYISRHTLPPHLAQFFLFDGEQVQRLAQVDMAGQVRQGIEGMLGASVLRDLERDLQEYAKNKRNELKDIASDNTLERVRKELDDEKESTLAAILEELPALGQERDQLRNHVASLQGGSIDNIKELQRRKDAIEHALARDRERLFHLMTNDLALAIAGRRLQKKVLDRLVAERELDAWEGSLKNRSRQLERFVEEFNRADPAIVPPLTQEQEHGLVAKIQVAWRGMWHPPPKNCADYYRHSYLGETDRSHVLERLAQVDGLGVDELQDLLHSITVGEGETHRLDQQLSAFSIGGLTDMILRLEAVSERVSELNSKRDTLKRELEALKATVTQKKAEYGRLSTKHKDAQPAFFLIEKAEKIGSMLPAFIEDATGRWVADIAKLMTEAYRDIAHKGTIHRVDIDPDCNVRLLTKGGLDYRSVDSSAGEDQVFAFALISAIARATKIPFPIVIDTPLARLDHVHRLNILRHFTERGGEQIILLSQDTEVTGPYLEAVRSRVAKVFKIEHTQIADGLGLNRVVSGKYFEAI